MAAVLVGIASYALGIYLSRSNIGSAFEAAGAMAVLLVALNYVAQIFLFGAILTKVYTYQVGSKRGKEEAADETDEASSADDNGERLITCND